MTSPESTISVFLDKFAIKVFFCKDWKCLEEVAGKGCVDKACFLHIPGFKKTKIIRHQYSLNDLTYVINHFI